MYSTLSSHSSIVEESPHDPRTAEYVEGGYA